MFHGLTLTLLTYLLDRIDILTRDKHDLEERIAFLIREKRQIAQLCDQLYRERDQPTSVPRAVARAA